MRPELLFRLLSDATRLRCVLQLHAHGSLCVCELTCALDMSQPKVSRHLAMLREGGLVADERRGQWVHYRIRDDLPEWARRVLDEAAAGQADSDPFAQDSARLAAMEARPSLAQCA